MTVPEPDSRFTNSTISPSTVAAATVPREDMATPIWRSSLSSSCAQILAPYCSPRASSRTAARSGPVMPCTGTGGAARRDGPSERSEGGALIAWAMIRSSLVSTRGGSFAQPFADDCGGLAGIIVGELADLFDGLGLQLAADFCDLQHLAGLALRDRGRRLGAGRGAVRNCLHQVGGGRRIRLDDAADQRAHDDKHDDDPQYPHHQELDGAHDVVLGELKQREQPAAVVDGERRSVGEAQVDHLDQIAAALIEADRRAHQGGDAIELFLWAFLIGDVAVLGFGVGAVDEHRDRNTTEPTAFDHLGPGGARYLVIGDLVGLLAILAGGGGVCLAAGQLVCDRDLARRIGGAGAFFLALGRAQYASLGVELFRRLGDTVEVEIGGELDAGAAGPDHRGHDGLDLIAQPPFEADLALLGGGPDAGILGRPIGEQPTAVIDDR